MTRRSLALLFLAACHHPAAPRPGVPSNTTPPSNSWAPTLAVSADHVPGWLAIAPMPDGSAGAMIVDHPEAAGQSLLVVPPAGDAQPAAGGDATTIPYGCDNNSLAIVPVRGAKLADGAAWVLPEPLPDTWSPAPVELRETAHGRALHTWSAGPLELALARVDDTHATFTITADGRTLLRETDEEVWMDGADPKPLDLTADFLPGVGEPRAVYLVAPEGPALVVLHTQGFEGETWSAVLVGADSAAPADTLTTYLYSCAF